MFRPHIFLLLIIVANSVFPATLSTKDGLAIDISPQGRITGCRLGAFSLLGRGTGGFSLCDYTEKPQLINLVPNGSFEEGDKGWRLGPGQSIDTTVAHTGRASARLEVPGPVPRTSNLEIFIPVKPNTHYIAELWLRRQNVGVCGAYISERDEANKLTGPVTQMGVSIPKQDNLWLPLRWKFTTQPQTTRVSFRADIYNSTGTIWLDDFFLAEVNEGQYEPVRGQIKAASGRVDFAGRVDKMGLQIEAQFQAEKECLRIDGVVADTTGKERAVGVRFALPVLAQGWSWADDIEEQRQIEPGRIYRNTYNCVSGLGLCSIYPWAALSGPQAGLSLALPLLQGPRVFILQHDGAQDEFSVTFFFGLTPKASHNPSRAPFSFVLYRHDPPWGLRSTQERYYKLFPESFVKRPPFEGYLNYANLERPELSDHTLRIGSSVLPDVNDFGEGYKFLHHVHGCYDFRQIPWPSSQPMTEAEVMAELQKMIQMEEKQERNYVPTRETIKKICRGPNGEILYIGDTRYWRAQEGYNHTDQPGWGLNFRVNEDPDISPHLKNVAHEIAQKYAETPHRPWDATFTADAIEGYMCNTHALNYNPEHFRTTLVPLTFGKDSLKPAMPNTIWDFHYKAWKPITEQYKIVTYGNSNGYEQAFTLPFVDIAMTEGSWDPLHPARLARYLRSLAHHKIWRDWHACDDRGGYGDANPAFVRRQFARGLAYAIYPPVYSIEVMSGNLEQYRFLYRQYVPAIEELNIAGWEPIPYAQAGDGLCVERFGSFATGELHFTISNWAKEAKTGTLQLDRVSLNIPPNALLVYLDILPGAARFQPFPAAGLPIQLEGEQTLALWIGTREQAAQHGFRLAERMLHKIDRTYYPEMDTMARQAWAAAVKIAQQGQKAAGKKEALQLAKRLQQALSSLPQRLSTKSPVDLLKLIYRAKTYVSMAPAALWGAELQAPRIVQEAPRGRLGELTAHLQLPSHCRLSEFMIQSPWDEIVQNSRAEEKPPNGSGTLKAQLFVPAEPPRQLLPYLLSVKGNKQGEDFELHAPVDVIPGTPIVVKMQPQRAFRGQERQITFSLENKLDISASVQMKLSAPAKTSWDQAEYLVMLPARSNVRLTAILKLDPMARLGAARIGYVITSPQGQYKTQGYLELLISDPVPQLRIKATTEPPRIDGKLDEAVWQQPPLIPELKIFSDGSPATEKTSVWMTYDKHGFYIAFRCHESQMDKLVARYTQRGDPLYLDDDVEVFVLPPEAPQAYQFAVNALGTQSDNFGNKTNWQAAAQRGEKEWTVELFVPYVAIGLQGPPLPTLPWNMQFGRQQKARRETTSWTPSSAFISRESMGEIFFD